MSKVIWKFQGCVQHLHQRSTQKKIFIVLFLLLVYFQAGRVIFHIKDWMDIPRSHAVCVDYRGGTANLMFQYAFHYSYARSHKLDMIKMGDFDLDKYFMLEDWDSYPNQSLTTYQCYYIRYEEDKYDCGYDGKFEKLKPGEDVYVHGYFQSWRYWVHYESDIRKLFQLQPYVKAKAVAQLNDILKFRNIDLKKDRTTLVGVHIRRGDYLQSKFSKFGYQLATPGYLFNAMSEMKKMYGNCLFIVCSNDMAWSEETLKNLPDVYFHRGSSAIGDMALLTQTNHTIMTVGTFSWWIGFLTNGTTIYYKYPFRAGSKFASQFPDGSTKDHFYPGWISLE